MEEDNEYPWYIRIYNGVKIDIYRLFLLFDIKNPMQQHAIKKIWRSGQSVKDLRKDIQEVIVTLERWLEILDEDKADSHTHAEILNKEKPHD
jgi:hypothetical protein